MLDQATYAFIRTRDRLNFLAYSWSLKNFCILMSRAEFGRKLPDFVLAKYLYGRLLSLRNFPPPLKSGVLIRGP